MPVVDFSVANRDPLEGTYTATLTKMELKQSQAGNDKLACEFTVTDPENEGRKAWIDLSLVPQALWATKPSLIALGYSPEKLRGKVDTDDIIEKCTGKECRLVLYGDEYQGKPQQKIREIRGLYDVY